MKECCVPIEETWTRPTVEEIYQYRKYVDVAVGELLSHIITNEMKNILEIGFNHETTTSGITFLPTLKYILGHNPLFPAL